MKKKIIVLLIMLFMIIPIISIQTKASLTIEEQETIYIWTSMTSFEDAYSMGGSVYYYSYAQITEIEKVLGINRLSESIASYNTDNVALITNQGITIKIQNHGEFKFIGMNGPYYKMQEITSLNEYNWEIHSGLIKTHIPYNYLNPISARMLYKSLQLDTQTLINDIYENGLGGYYYIDDEYNINFQIQVKDTYDYGLGYSDAMAMEEFSFWEIALSSVMLPFTVLSIELMPGIPIGIFALIPIVFGLIAFFFSFKGGKK